MGIAYADLVTQLAAIMEYNVTALNTSTPTDSPDFNAILPAVINDAEQRIYRDVQFLHVRQEDATLTVNGASRNFTIPSEIYAVESLSLVVPSIGRVPAMRTSKSFIDSFWPNSSATQTPTRDQLFFTMLNDTTAIVAPTPDNSYVAEVTGLFRPATMSATNKTTYIGTNFPDLLLAAAVVFAVTYQRDFSQTQQGQQMATTWEGIFQDRLKSVMAEDAMRKGAAAAPPPAPPPQA